MLFWLLLLAAIAILGWNVYTQRYLIKSWLIEVIMAHVGLEMNRVRVDLDKYQGKSVARMENRHLVVEFFHDDKLCKLMLPYNRRLAHFDSQVLCLDKEGKLSEYHHPKGIKFPTTASALGLDQIIRINSLSQERIVYSGNQEII